MTSQLREKLFAVEEVTKIVRFFLEEAWNPETEKYERCRIKPMSTDNFEQFIHREMPCRSVSSVFSCIVSVCNRNDLDEKEGISMEEVAAVCFLCDTPLADRIIKKMRKIADMELSWDNRILAFKSKRAAGFVLENTLDQQIFSHGFTLEEDESMWKFVLENARKTESAGKTKLTPIKWNKLCSQNGQKRATRSYGSRFSRMKYKIHLTNFDVETKLALYKILQVPINKSYLAELRKNAHITVDQNRCLIEYVEKTKELGETEDAKGEKQEEKKGSDGNLETSDRLCEFLLQRNRDPITGKILKAIVDTETTKVFEEFKMTYQCSDSAEELREHFLNDLCPNLHYSEFDLKTKALMYYSFDIPICSEFIPKLEHLAVIAPSGRILESPEDDVARIFSPDRRTSLTSNQVTGVEDEKVQRGNEVVNQIEPDERDESQLFMYSVEDLDNNLLFLNDDSEKSLEDGTNGPMEQIRTEEHVFGKCGWFSKEEDDAMWQFIYENIHNPETGQVESGSVDWKDRAFWCKFKTETKSVRGVNSLRDRFQRLVPKLEDAEICKEMKLKLYFALGIPVTEDFLVELRKDAKIELNDCRCIVSYQINGQLDLQTLMNSEKPFTADEDSAILKFVFDRIDQPEKGDLQMLKKTFWEDFKKDTGCERPYESLKRRFRSHLLPNYHLTNASIGMKIKLYHALKVPVNKNVLEKLRADALIIVNEKRLIESYSLCERQDPADVHKKPPESFTPKEMGEMWKYVLDKVRHPMTGIAEKTNESYNSTQFWQEFKEMTGGRRETEKYRIRFALIMAPNIHLTQFVTQTKVELYYGLNVPVDEEFLKTLREEADVEVDENGCITRFQQRRTSGFILNGNGKNGTNGKRKLTKESKTVKRQKTRKEEEKYDEILNDGVDRMASDVRGVQSEAETSCEPASRPRASTPRDMHGNIISIEQQINLRNEQTVQREDLRKRQEAELMTTLPQEKTSGREFLIALRKAVSQLESENFSGILKTIDKEMESLRNEDKMIPIRLIRSLLDNSAAIAVLCKNPTF